MTCAEILVSVTGLMFAYSQAPKRYKTVIMSAWLLTSAIGDLIVVFVAQVHLVKNQVRKKNFQLKKKFFIYF
jgi:dipeptide/tripeptide permease